MLYRDRPEEIGLIVQNPKPAPPDCRYQMVPLRQKASAGETIIGPVAVVSTMPRNSLCPAGSLPMNRVPCAIPWPRVNRPAGRCPWKAVGAGVAPA